MAFIPNNSFENVVTYVDASLGSLQNQNCYIGTLNTKFKYFNGETANLGNTINIELPNRAIYNNGLVASFTPVDQLLQPLICDQAANSSNAFTAQNFIFNAEQYMEKFGEARVNELGAGVEYSAGLNNISAVPVFSINSDGQSVPTGALHTESGPFRFFGNGITPISSFQQVARMCAFHRTFGAAKGALDIYFDDLAQTDVIGTGQNQFVLDRNEKLSNSWDIGMYKPSNANFYVSNRLPIQYAGEVGNSAVAGGNVLTVVSTNDPTGANITQITCSTTISDTADAIKSGDLAQVTDDAPNALIPLRYLSYTGHTVSKAPVQIRMTADAASVSNTVVLSIFPPLVSAPGVNQNLNKAIVAGMTLKVMPSHRAGLIVSGKAFYLAMPALPDEVPYPSATATDSGTGVSLRNYFGSIFGKNQRGFITDCIWATTAVPHYTSRILFPLTQDQPF